LDPLDVCGHGPHFFVRIPLAVSKHAGSADAVFDDPKYLRFGIFGADLRQLWGRWKQPVVVLLLGFSRSAVTTGAPADIEPAASDEVLVSGSDGVWHFRRFAANRGVNGRPHQQPL
jgi:hypothetical protein